MTALCIFTELKNAIFFTMTQNFAVFTQNENATVYCFLANSNLDLYLDLKGQKGNLKSKLKCFFFQT